VWLEEVTNFCGEKKIVQTRKCLPIITQNKFSLREQSFRREYGTKLVLDGKNVKEKNHFNTATLFC